VSDFNFEWPALGAAIERDPRFPHRTNVSFVKPVDANTVEVRFWERGAGLTNSSGTGSTGAVGASIALGLVAAPVSVQTLAGTLAIRAQNSVLFLTGPADLIGDGIYYSFIVVRD
jgi:diaminopimelate epimerase